jgi:hypothetical protein
LLKEKAMRTWSAVLIVSLALFAPSSSYGRGGISRGARSSGFSGGSNVANSSGRSVRSSTRRDGSQVSGKTASSKSTRSSSSNSNTKSLADEAFSPAITPPASLVSHGSISGSTGTSSTTNSKSSAALLPSANTTNSSSNANQLANQTAAGNLQFLGGYPVLGLALSSGYLNQDTAAQRQYGGLVSNARNLIRAGIYPEAANLLQRVINNVPGTRIAGVAQQLLSRIPVQ